MKRVGLLNSIWAFSATRRACAALALWLTGIAAVGVAEAAGTVRGPRLVFEPEKIDFGTKPAGMRLRGTFILKISEYLQKLVQFSGKGFVRITSVRVDLLRTDRCGLNRKCH